MKEPELSSADVRQNYANSDEWNVEQFDTDGTCYMAIFIGPNAKRRAEEYAGWRNRPKPRPVS
jgi:hypothetical protein